MEAQQQSEKEKVEGDECPPEDGASEDVTAEKKSKKISFLDEVFPRLSAHGGNMRYPRSRSVAILLALYCSHVFSAWGDRMWQFLVTLLLALLYPGSLLLPAIFGLVLTILPALLGTVLGDFVDGNPRMRVVWVSLLVQNSLVCACSVGLAILFGLDLGICGDVSLYVFIILTSGVILLGASANLATVVNTIAVEKDWVVVIADKNEDILASLNANMRRIDLICKLLAPAVAGVILQFTGPLTTTIVVAGWNFISFFVELGLIWLVYHWVPALAVKKLRKSLKSVDEPLIEEEEGEGEKEEEEEEGDLGEGEKLKFFDEDEENEEAVAAKKIKGHANSAPHQNTCCSRLLAPYVSLRAGWGIYWRQEIALAGLAMAAIYLTVLGFSGVTASYFLTQGLPNAAIGAGQGVGAIFGVTGTFAYPFIRRRIGTVRTGMFGISCQLTMLLLCLVAVGIPAERVENTAEGYFSAHCPADETVCDRPPSNPSLLPTTSFSLSLPTTSLPTSSHSLLSTSLSSPLPTPSPSPVSSGDGSGDLLRPMREAEADSGSSVSLTSPTPSPTCTTKMTSSGSEVELNRERLLPLLLMLAGIIFARFGIWIFDLSIQQRVQETVAEETRGAVGGVMNAMNSVMDMMHYVLVIAAPRPEHFPILVAISVAMVALGAVLYAVYVRIIRGHFFHCRQWWGACRSRGGRGHSYSIVTTDNPQNSVVNEAVL